jgi:hypothetical protein
MESESSTELFRIVVGEVKSFAPTAVELLGLGTWEPGMKAGAFEQVAQRVREPAPAPPRAPAEPFAYPVILEPANDSTALPAIGEARIVVAPDESCLKLRLLSEQPAVVVQRLGAELQEVEHRDRGAAESIAAQQMMMNPQLGVTGEPALQRARIELLPDVWVAVRFTGLLRQRGFDLLMRLYRQARRSRH